MDIRAKWWKGVQNGEYAPIEAEEGKHESEVPIEKVVILPKAPSLLVSLETLVRIICVLVFFAGAVMMGASRTTTTTNTRKHGPDSFKKDVECTEQLSVWCEFTLPLNTPFRDRLMTICVTQLLFCPLCDMKYATSKKALQITPCMTVLRVHHWRQHGRL